MMTIERRTLGVLVIAASAFTAQAVSAAKWDFQQKLRFQAEATDNIFLSDDDPEPSGLFTITPILSGSTEAKTTTIYLEAAVDLEAFSNPEENLARPKLFAGIDAEPIAGTFFIDTSVQVRRSTLDEDLLLRDFPNPDDDLVYVADYRFRPQFNFSFDDVASLELDLRLKHEDFLEEAIRDESEVFFFGELLHVPESSGVYWALSTSAFGADASDNTDFSNVHAKATLGYAFSNSWLTTVSVGHEQFEERDILDSRFIESEAEDDTWEVAVQWTPDERTVFNAGFGHRVFGRDVFKVMYKG